MTKKCRNTGNTLYTKRRLKDAEVMWSIAHQRLGLHARVRQRDGKVVIGPAEVVEDTTFYKTGWVWTRPELMLHMRLREHMQKVAASGGIAGERATKRLAAFCPGLGATEAVK
jgi:hypothetical protein